WSLCVPGPGALPRAITSRPFGAEDRLGNWSQQTLRHRSALSRRLDRLAAVNRVERLEGGEVHAVAQEAHGPVAEQEVRPAGVPTAEAPLVLEQARAAAHLEDFAAVGVVEVPGRVGDD